MLRQFPTTAQFLLTEEGQTVMFRLVEYHSEDYVTWAGYESDENGNFIRTVVFSCYYRDSLEEMYDSYLSKKNLHGSMKYDWEEAEETWNESAN